MSDFPLRARLYLAVSLASTAAYFALRDLDDNVIYDAMGVAAAIALFVGARARPLGRRAAWYLLGTGMIGWVGGDIIWTGYSLADVEPPYPGVGDALYLSSYPLWAAGLWLLARRLGGRAHRTVLIDAGIVASSAGLLSWVFLIHPLIEPSQPLATVLVSVAFPIGDLLLITVLARMVLGPGRRTRSDRLLLAGVVANLVADTSYSVALMGSGYEARSWIDLGWLLFLTCWGSAALAPSPHEALPPQAVDRAMDAPAKATPFARVGLAAASLVVPALLLIQAATGRHGDEGAIAIAMVVTTVLTGVRVGIMFEVARRDAADLAAQGWMLRRALDDLTVVERERIRLLDRTVRATEEERARIAVELHDGPIQRLTALSFRLGRARTRMRTGHHADVERSLERAERDLSDHIGELRRLMSDLRPPALDQGGLEAALGDQVDAFRKGSGTEVSLEAHIERELDTDTQVVLYRIMQEALANVARHARARTVSVRLAATNGHATLEIVDDGVGFEEDRTREFASQGHFGLAGMAQRASMVGGTFAVTSAPGRGTRIRVDVPARKAS